MTISSSSSARLILAKPMIRAVLSTTASPSPLLSKTPFYDKFGPLKGLAKAVRSSTWNLCVQKCYRNSFSITARSKFAWGSVFGASIIIGSIYPRQHITYAMNGFDILEDDCHLDRSDASDIDEVPRNFLLITRKVVLPFLLFLTVLVNWYHPAILAAKVILFLVGTKPSPLSIYISIERLRHQYMRQQPIFFRFKSLYANKVEVEDYAFMCLARVELNDQKFTLVGILGNWWIFPPFAVFRDQVMQYIRN